MAKKKAAGPVHHPDDTKQNASTDSPPDRPVRIDEYIDDKYDVRELDALDVPYALRSDALLDDVADDSDGIEEVDVLSSHDDVTVDSGVRRHARDDADMGLGAEPHSAEELDQAALGDALPGRRGVTRDNELHGRALLDDIDDVGGDELR